MVEFQTITPDITPDIVGPAVNARFLATVLDEVLRSRSSG
jgi:hypothetical protein